MSLVERIMEWMAPRPAKTWPLDNQVQAQALAGILNEEGIAFRIRRHGEALWGYAEQAQEGWGHLEVDAEDVERTQTLYCAFLESIVEATSEETNSPS